MHIPIIDNASPYTVTILLGSVDFRTTKRTNIRKSTRGKIARTPSTVSTNGVFCHIVSGSVADDAPAAAAFAIISSGLIEKETNMASIRTARIGNKDAIVTTPKPDREESPLPAAFAIPMPKDNTSGTVTGPVVTAPQSHASPSMLFKLGSNQAYIVRITTGKSAA